MNQNFFMIYRFFDLMLSSAGLILTAPLMASIFIIGSLENGAPIYRQKRVGKGKIEFTMFKFRSMALDTDSRPTHLIDPSSVTIFGHFLRQTKLDELPQLWNVLVGNMSFVGPRPGLPDHLELMVAREKYKVFSVRPGITGLSQISGIDMSNPELLATTDARMIAEMSVYNYFKYIIFTTAGKGRGDRIRL